jgi:hypothetical protein
VGKTLGAILTIGAAIAINVIPGVGQAISGAVFGALSTVTGTIGTLASVAFTIGQIAPLALTLAGVASLGGILQGGPPKPDTASTAIKTSRPPRVSAYGLSRLYPAAILYETAEDGTAVDVGAVHDGQLTEIVQRYLADDKITLSGNVVNEGSDGRYKGGKLSFYTTDGSSPGAPLSAVVAKLPGIWTSNHRGDGVVLVALLSSPVKSKDFLDVYPNGVPVASIAAKWQKCPDFHAADPTDEAGWTWTENPIRQLGHYKLKREGIDYATKIAPTLAYWQAAQDVCDEPVPLKAGGTEARYRSCLSHKHTDTHGSVSAGLLTACDGWIAPRSDGALVVYAGKYIAPTVSIGPEHIIAYEWSGVGVDDDDAVNEIVCSYVSADHDYNTVECDAWRDEDDIAARGQVLSQDFEPQVPSWGQVRRLAKIKMARANAIYRGSVTTNVSGRIVRGQRFINLLLQDAGATFYDGPAEITAVTRNIATGGVTFTWVAVSPNAYAWNPATEEGEPAPVGDRVALEPLEAPILNSVSVDHTSNIGGDTGARLEADGTGPDRDDLTWYLRWRLDGDPSWVEQEYQDQAPGAAVTLFTTPVPLDNDIDVEISYRAGDGRISDWSNTVTVST